MKNTYDEIPRKIWKRISGIIAILSKQELTNPSKQELTKTQNQIQKLCDEFIQVISLYCVESESISVDVGVVIITKNRPQLLLRALSSINTQSRKAQEIVIVNNGKEFSVSEELEFKRICKSVSKIQIINGHEFHDVSSCRAVALSAVTTKYVTYLDDDNLMWPLWLEGAFDYLSKNNIDFVYGIQLREDTQPSYFFHNFCDSKIRQANFIDTNSIMHTRLKGRWTPGVSRLSDWSFVLNFLSDHPELKITPLETISTIYKTDAPDRITTSLYSPYKVLIGLLHNLIPSSEQIIEKMIRYCVICNNASSFSPGPNGRKNAACSNCGSLERHRALKIINEVVFDDLMRNQVTGKIIEVAPSGVSRSIFSPYGSNYESFDIDPSADGRDCDFIADLCEMPLANNSVTGFVALHVLEHISNDQQAFQEISRVMAPTGVCILQVPLAEYPQVTQEEFIKDDELRIQRYGQVDHVRLYGEDIIQRMQKNGLEGCFFSIEEMLPDFLMEILGLRDGAKFILATPNEYDLTKRDLNEIVSRLKNDFSRLEIFCELFKNEE